MSRFNDIKVREKDGFTTFYDPEDQKFVLRDPDGNEVGSGITQEKAERKLLMKALSIKQPYAWLIGKGIKDVENRIWWIHMPPLLNYPAMPRHIDRKSVV